MMAAFSTIILSVALRLFILTLTPLSAVTALPMPQPSSPATASSDYWIAGIQRQGQATFNTNAPTYKVFRNVKDFGAKGDGISDDTDAINAAVSDGTRCGQGCDSSTTTPALVYFPPGTYLVSKPIVQLYYTQFVGDALSVPTIKATPGFQGIAVIDSDPYNNNGQNWYTNQNNFFRQIRNFVIDITAMPPTVGAGIHWQVAQATSLQNIRFEMIVGGDNNKQQGIFMDNGSGGMMVDLTFNGGNYGAFFGNQQFTTRNLVFNNCKTAIFMNWNWLWTFKSVSINNCGVGIDMANGVVNGVGNQTVGSILLQDSKISNTPIGVKTAFNTNSNPPSGGTLILDNVDFSSCSVAVADPNGGTILAGGQNVVSWVQGKQYTGPSGSRVQAALTGPTKPAGLLTSSGTIFEREKPQYQEHPVSCFISAKSSGCKGDGVTDDTACIQKFLDGVSTEHIAYFDHGAYIVSDTIEVPKDIKITGEMWPLILAKGAAFADQANPKPVFQVGQAGDQGAVEMSDLLFATVGAQPGAIMMEWNVEGEQGANGLWDVHFRIGGSAGTQLQSDKCAKNPTVTAAPNPQCEAAFLLLHIKGSVYLENNWFWVADHELDLADHGQINIFNGRGVLVESTCPVWMYGTSSEHSVLYNYQVLNSDQVYMGLIQTETPYFQSNPDATVPFTAQSDFSDPDFSTCTTPSCKKAWGLRVLGSTNTLIYGAGLYSFFDNYGQTCLETESCQENMVDIQNSSVHLFGLSTKASTNMVTAAGGSVPQSDNRSNFCSTIALFQSMPYGRMF